jgi:uncharacterized membrane protein required for colicin V production
MIGAAILQKLSMDKLPVNWFDGLVLAMLILGLFRGRKHGMSLELLPLSKWLAIVLVSGFCYQMVAQLLANTAGLSKSASYIWSYLGLAFVVFLFFLMIKSALGHRFAEHSFFGSAEYYLGMISGLVRFACMLLFALALLNAPFYTEAEIQAHDAYVKRWYGGGMYSGNYFPSLQVIQEQVFKTSFSGPYIKDYVGFLMVQTASPSTKETQKAPVVNIQK